MLRIMLRKYKESLCMIVVVYIKQQERSLLTYYMNPDYENNNPKSRNIKNGCYKT